MNSIVPSRRRSRQASHRKAAWALCLGLAFFVLGQAGVRFLVRNHRPDLRDPTFEKKAALFQARLNEFPDAPAIVMFGSSCTVYGFRGQEVEAFFKENGKRRPIVFNFGNFGAGPLVQRVYLDRLLARGIRPNLVILEVLPHFYHPAGSDLGRLPAEILSRSDIALLRNYGGSESLLEQYKRCRVAPLYGYRLAILSQFMPRLVPVAERMTCWKEMDASGWCAMIDYPEEQRKALTRSIPDHCTHLKDFSPTGTSWRVLEDTLAMLKERGVPTLVVLGSEGATLRSVYPPDQIDLFYRKLHAQAKKSNVPLIDARDWFEENAFPDGLHLSPSAASVFTRRLSEVICDEFRR